MLFMCVFLCFLFGKRVFGEYSGQPIECDPPCNESTTVCTQYLGDFTCLIVNNSPDQKCVPKCRDPEDCLELTNGETMCNYGRMVLHFCDSQPCRNGATCSERKNLIGINVGFRCQCTPQWVGVICDRPKSDACTPDPCQNGCRCMSSCRHERGYQCIGEETGYIGTNCDIAVPSVDCGENEMVVGISRAFYEEFDGSIENSFMFANPSANQQVQSDDQCAAEISTNGDVQLRISLPFIGQCGTRMGNDSVAEGIVFENRIWINRNTNLKIDMPVPVLDFSCVYARQYDIMSSLEPLTDPNVVKIVRSGSFEANVEMCKISSCPQKCPTQYQVLNEAVYTIGEMIHVRINVETNQKLLNQPDLVLTVEDIFLSCSSDIFMPEFAQIVAETSSCPGNPGFPFSVTSGQIASPHSVCLSFQVPKAANCDLFFLHARLSLCAAVNVKSCEHPNFAYCASRSKRSSDDHDVMSNDVTYTFIGPIHILRGSRGRKIEQLLIDGQPGNVVTFTDDKDPDDYPSTPPTNRHSGDLMRVFLVLGICAIATTSFIIFAFYFIRRWKSNRRTLALET
uniref:Transmembrane protein Vc569 n=1 Tax=Phallusia mammillata TaxID=59560 RepID=A0A6F9DTU0_9ASCI|nr:transmembrane protein Vc569 [Phallusia mammillata]